MALIMMIGQRTIGCSSRDPRAAAEQSRSVIVGTPEYHDDQQGGVLCPTKNLFTLYKPVHETGVRPADRF
jgi:hypothetical protein